MVDVDLKILFIYFFVSGAIGSLIGVLLSVFSSNKNRRLDASAAIGFLVGCGFGTLAGIFVKRSPFQLHRFTFVATLCTSNLLAYFGPSG